MQGPLLDLVNDAHDELSVHEAEDGYLATAPAVRCEQRLEAGDEAEELEGPVVLFGAGAHDDALARVDLLLELVVHLLAAVEDRLPPRRLRHVQLHRRAQRRDDRRRPLRRREVRLAQQAVLVRELAPRGRDELRDGELWA